MRREQSQFAWPRYLFTLYPSKSIARGQQVFMENAQSFFQSALDEADEKIAHIDSESLRMQGELRRKSEEKTILVGTRKALLIQLGKLAPEKSSLEDNATGVSKNAFKGMAPAVAARKHLQEIGHGLTHAELVEVLLKGNVKTDAKRPSDSIRTSIQRRPEWFRWVKRKGSTGYWELVEWPETGEAEAVAEQLADTPAIPPPLSLVEQPKLTA